MTRPLTEIHDKIRYVRAAERSGILERKGAQAELARILGVSKQYVGYLRKRVMAEGLADQADTEQRGTDGH